VDPDRLRQLLDHAAAGLPVTFSDFEPVRAAEVWLRAVDTARSHRAMATENTRDGKDNIVTGYVSCPIHVRSANLGTLTVLVDLHTGHALGTSGVVSASPDR
jgi:hypothetical protein